VIFHVPTTGGPWRITVNGTDMFYREDIDPQGCAGGTLSMEVSTSGAGSIGCSTP
jgi:hypothetical protein